MVPGTGSTGIRCGIQSQLLVTLLFMQARTVNTANISFVDMHHGADLLHLHLYMISIPHITCISILPKTQIANS